MNEIETVADRIGVLNSGQLEISGRPRFVKEELASRILVKVTYMDFEKA